MAKDAQVIEGFGFMSDLYCTSFWVFIFSAISPEWTVTTKTYCDVPGMPPLIFVVMVKIIWFKFLAKVLQCLSVRVAIDGDPI